MQKKMYVTWYIAEIKLKEGLTERTSALCTLQSVFLDCFFKRFFFDVALYIAYLSHFLQLLEKDYKHSRNYSRIKK